MIPKLQIAGIKTEEEARLCAEAGADGYGLLLMLDYPRGDALDIDTVTRLASWVRANTPGGASVLITHSTDPAAVVGTAKKTGVTAVQVHNDSAEEMPLDVLRGIKAGLGDTALIKVLHVPAKGPPDDALLAHARSLAEIADALILDSKAIETIDGKQFQTLGGTGHMNDWDIARDIVRAVAPCPVIYAGGLTPANVADAILHVRPWGVDVNSGTRKDGSVEKDPEKVRSFITSAAQAFDSLPAGKKT